MKAFSLFAAALVLTACRAPAAPNGPYQPVSESERSALLAEELSHTAADLIYEDPTEAERLLRSALTADIYYGPAHNNLGVLFLEQGKLFEAANEFEWARKLMPGAPDPRMNLALTLETAGRVQDAIEEYQTALEVSPNHVPSMQAFARLLMQRDRKDQRLAALLTKVAMRSESEDWRAWARDQIGKP